MHDTTSRFWTTKLISGPPIAKQVQNCSRKRNREMGGLGEQEVGVWQFWV
jgi:hypothetical protein